MTDETAGRTGVRANPASRAGEEPIIAEISLFYPMFNEEENIEEATERARRVLERLAGRYEIILVNDGSRDRTGEMADSLAAADPRVRPVHHPVNRGYGAALRSGIEASRYEWIFYTDGDNQFDLEELPRFLGMREGLDMVLGYRSPRRDPWIRKLNALGFNLLCWILLDVRVKDVDCAFKLFRRSIFQGMELRAEGATIDLEILARARAGGARWKEAPVRHYPRLYGQQTGANLKVVLRAFKELFRLWKELRLGGAGRS